MYTLRSSCYRFKGFEPQFFGGRSATSTFALLEKSALIHLLSCFASTSVSQACLYQFLVARPVGGLPPQTRPANSDSRLPLVRDFVPAHPSDVTELFLTRDSPLLNRVLLNDKNYTR